MLTFHFTYEIATLGGGRNNLGVGHPGGGFSNPGGGCMEDDTMDVLSKLHTN